TASSKHQQQQRLSSFNEEDDDEIQPPRLSFTLDPSKHDADRATYRCLSSVLKKDGKVLCAAVSNGFLYTGAQGNVVRIWKLPEFKEFGQLKTRAAVVVALQLSHDRVYAAYEDGKIRVWRRTWDGAVKHERIATLPTPGSLVRNYIPGGGRDRTGKHSGPISAMAINAADDILYTASLDRTVKVWRISDFACIETIQAHPDPVNAVALAEEEGLLYTASDDATVRVWRRNFCANARSHSLTVTLPTKCSPVKALALTSDGALLYGGCTDGYVHYWLKGWLSGQLQYGGALAGHTHAVLCLSTATNFVVSGSADATSRIWSRDPDGLHTCMTVLHGHRGPVRCVTIFPGRYFDETGDEGCTLSTGSFDGAIKVWRVRNS
ncbi:hypothetical protein M569_05112, partial [Genlisea aurea]